MQCKKTQNSNNNNDQISDIIKDKYLYTYEQYLWADCKHLTKYTLNSKIIIIYFIKAIG